MSSNRLQFIDALRALAALSVLVQHTFEKISPHFAEFTTMYFQFGVFGVTLFFLCSGFIIPTSLERQNSLKVFWKRRFFRLYPLYIFSLILALLLIQYQIGQFEGRDIPSLPIILIHLTMLTKFLAIPPIIGLYWTLSLEMVFYILMSILFLLKLNKHSFWVANFALVTAIFIAINTKVGAGLAFNLATMFVGTVFFRYFINNISRKKMLIVFFFAIITLLIVTLNCFNDSLNNFHEFGARSFWPVTNAWLGAYSVFMFVMLRSNCFKIPYFVQYLGTISYSIYLMQGITLPLIPNDVAFSPYIKMIATIVLSAGTYYFIEKPGIHMGHYIKIQLSAQFPIERSKKN